MNVFSQTEVGNDWLVTAICLGFLLPLFSIGQDVKSYKILLRKMLTFKVPGNELSMAAYSLPGNIVAMLSFSVSAASVLYCIAPAIWGNTFDQAMQLRDLSVLALFSGMYLMVRMTLYSVMNPIIFRTMRLSRDQYRWPVFCQMNYMIVSQALSLVAMSIVFLVLTPLAASVVLALSLVLMKIEVFIALYDTLFGSKGNYFIFFAYLCAVELAPALGGWFIIAKFVLIF